MMIANPLYKFLGNRLSPAGPNGRLSILIYHRVHAGQDPLFPHEATMETFDAQMSRLKAVFNVLSLSEAIVRLKNGTLPARAACITFDDGYADNATIALPILQQHGLIATFFIATAYLNGGRMFNDTVIEAIRRTKHDILDLTELGLGQHDTASNEAKARAISQILPIVKHLPLGEREAKVARLCELTKCGELPTNLMMTTGQLTNLHAAGMEIGGHTARHPILAKLNEVDVRKEIAEGKDFLEGILGERIRLFAYPNGKPGADYLSEQASIVRDMGFDAAVSTQWGAASRDSDIYQLPRFTPWSPKPSRFVPMLLQNLRR
jgi:peptidoglycan/xylan/chitin deacetylase (PgdA/CDA1 family)